MFESSKLHCRLHCLGVEVTNGYRGHVFRLGPCFFFPFHKPNYYECAFFLAKPTTHARVVRHTILKRNERKNHEHKATIPCQTTTCDTMKLRSTPQSEDALMIMSLIVSSPQSKTATQTATPPLHMARTWMDMHRLRRLHDSQYIMKTHLQMKIQTYQIYFTTIYIGKRSKASRCEAPKSFYANLLGFLADSSGVGGRGGSP